MFINQHHRQGIAAFQQGSLEEALRELNLALKENPAHPDILSDRGFLYMHLGEKLLALEDFDLSQELQPEYGYRYASRGYARDFFGDAEGAEEDYRCALTLDPNDGVSHNNLGLILEKQGIHREAAMHFEQADALKSSQGFDITEAVDGEQKPIERSAIPPSDLVRRQENTLDEMKKIFASQEQFTKFIDFLKKGFGRPQ